MGFENKLVGTIYYSRFIASYVKIMSKYGQRFRRGDFKKWLEGIGELTDEEIIDICNMADNGKLELEQYAEDWFRAKEDYVPRLK